MPEVRSDQGETSLSLLERARGNDPDAWKRLIHLYGPLVRYWCGRAGLTGPDAEDVAQEVFAAAAVNLPRFRRDRPGDSFRAWLRAITRNGVLLWLRRNRGQPRGEGGSDALHRLQGVPDPLAPDDEEALQVSALYRRAVEQVRCEFEERTWRAFWRTVIEGRTAADLAAELGVTPAAVRQARSRVLRRLKQEMGELLE
jgi:RNA polymerase sigma-70 factor (ECF subfamily)